MVLTRRKKILWGLLVALAFLLVLELAARGFSRFRYGNPVAFAYGYSFLGRIVDGTVALDHGWGSGRGGDEVAADRAAAEGTDVEALFNRRHDRTDVPALRKPVVINFNGGHSATLNNIGYRGRDHARQIADGVHRIAAFGGSYVFGGYLRDDQTWPHLLEQNLQALGVRTEVVNAGTPGANVHGTLSTVITTSNWMDIDTAVVTTGYNNHPLLPIERRYTVLRRADFVLYNVSLLYVMVKERIAKSINQPLDYGLYNQPIRVDPASVTWLIDLYRKRLEQIATLCQERGISLVLASEAELFFRSDLNAQSSQTPAILDAMAARVQRDQQLTMAELEYYLQGLLNRTARDVAEARGAQFFDGEAALLTADKRRNFADQIHPNEIGAALLARGLADALAPAIRASSSR